jgi:hypothetical protein
VTVALAGWEVMDGATGLEEVVLVVPELQEIKEGMKGACRSKRFRSEDNRRFSRTDSHQVGWNASIAVGCEERGRRWLGPEGARKAAIREPAGSRRYQVAKRTQGPACATSGAQEQVCRASLQVFDEDDFVAGFVVHEFID